MFYISSFAIARTVHWTCIANVEVCSETMKRRTVATRVVFIVRLKPNRTILTQLRSRSTATSFSAGRVTLCQSMQVLLTVTLLKINSEVANRQ